MKRTTAPFISKLEIFSASASSLFVSRVKFSGLGSEQTIGIVAGSIPSPWGFLERISQLCMVSLCMAISDKSRCNSVNVLKVGGR